MKRWMVAAAMSWVIAGPLCAEPPRFDRSIGKQPAYKTAPKYGLLAFGPEGKDRVWLVRDGNVLYVDRNGNGDLTEPGEKIAAKVDKSRDPAEFGYTFEVGDLTVGGKVHKALTVTFVPISLYAGSSNFTDFPPFQAAMKADPKALMTYVAVDVQSARLKGSGVEGRLSYAAGCYDDQGLLLFGTRPDNGPIMHFDGPLCATFYGRAPTLRLARDNDLILMVGTPGRGPGTFAMLNYQDAIPQTAFPKVEIVYARSDRSSVPSRDVYELKERC